MKNRDLTRREIAELRLNYPPGTRIMLEHMEDNWAVPRGTRGSVTQVDDAGTIHMKWDNGRTLPLRIGEDSFSLLPPETTTMKLYMPLKNPPQASSV